MNRVRAIIGAIASMNLDDLTRPPRRLGNPECSTPGCRSSEICWNPLIRRWQCPACRTQWSSREMEKTYRADLTEPDPVD